MAKARVRTNDRFIDRTTGDEVIVLSVGNDGNRLSNGKMVSKKQLKNCFIFTGNNTPAPAPDKELFSVSNGELAYNGEPVFTGSLYVKKVLFTYSGHAVFTVKGKDKPDLEDVFIYDMEEDRFEKDSVGMYEIKTYNIADGVISLLKEWMAISETDGPDGPAKEIRFTNRFEIWGPEGKIYEGDENPGTFVASTKCGKNTLSVFTQPNKYSRVESPDPEKKAVVYGWAHTEGNGVAVSAYVYGPNPDDKDGSMCMSMISNNSMRVAPELGGILRITPVISGAYGDVSLLVVCEKGFVYTNNGYSPRQARGKDVSNAALAHSHLVHFDPGTHVNRFVLADDNYNIATVTVTKRDDGLFVNEIM